MFAACVIAAGARSVLLGKDANWDLKNYHWYNAWAVMNGRLGETEWLGGGEYSIADIATIGWARGIATHYKMDMKRWPHLQRWIDSGQARLADPRAQPR